MLNILLAIFIIALAGWSFGRCNAIGMRRLRAARRRRSLSTDFEDYATDPERHTIELIGEKAFREMASRIDDIMRIHADHNALTLPLTCGPDSDDGARQLHKLLPGAELRLSLCSEGGVEWIDVFHDGVRIGRLALMEASTLKEMMINNAILAAYVAEQNCYGIENSHNISIIVFYEARKSPKSDILSQLKSKRLRQKGSPSIIDICQN